ncbi:MAG: sugar ABC transporter permease, partial [Endomicrobia bacterium]|nr:sugar ABC transporter permease [Endomicrobiia bacterium]
WKSMANAGIITVLALTLQNGLALLLALLVTKNIRGENIYRTIFFLPPVLSGIVVGLIWKFVFDGNFGILNHFLTSIGFSNFADYAWLSEVRTALFSVAVVHMWKGFGYGFIILLAGLQTIPVELYEAAEVDGADSWQQFKNITFPLLIPIFTIVSILTILGSMQIFDLIYSMTRGGPAGHTHVPITKIYEYMSNGEFGYSTAMAVVFGMVLLIISFAQIYASKKLNYNNR